MADDDDANRMITCREAAVILGLKVGTVRRMTRKRELPVFKPTGRRAVRLRVGDLREILRQRNVLVGGG